MLFGQHGGLRTGSTLDPILSENRFGTMFIHRSSLASEDPLSCIQKTCAITNDTIRSGIRKANLDGIMKS
jgi:hypothetical protein